MIYYVMGVSGSGKSTVGRSLAEQLGLPFFDGDDFHPDRNVAKMAKGLPLDDEDRLPWLKRLSQLAQAQAAKQGAVIATSALKASYRQILQEGIEPSELHWILLHGDPALIQQRMEQRKDHFMPPGLLRSQLETLEIPERAIHVDIDQSPVEQVRQILRETT
jgi:carbohydrate kinase (thermoresistant glucokinase family)